MASHRMRLVNSIAEVSGSALARTCHGRPMEMHWRSGERPQHDLIRQVIGQITLEGRRCGRAKEGRSPVALSSRPGLPRPRRGPVSRSPDNSLYLSSRLISLAQVRRSLEALETSWKDTLNGQMGKGLAP